MANIQRMGTASRIDPPLSIGGETYSLLLQFKASPEEEATSDIVTGRIAWVEDLGGGRYKFVFDRALVPSSVTRVIPGFGGYEHTWYSNCGGNICNTPEPLRIYNWLNQDAARGDLSHRRAIERDMAWIGAPGAERGYFIEEAVPFGTSPIGGVNYWPTSNLPFVSYIATNWGDYSLPVPDRATNPDAAIDWSLSTGFFAGRGLYIDPTSGSDVLLTRKIFGGDEELYPDGATLALGEYWLNGRTFEFRLGSANSSTGSAVYAYYFERGLRQVTLEDSLIGVLEGNGAGYNGTGADDDRAHACFVTRENGTIGLFLIEGGAEAYGVGAIEWDFPDIGRKVALLFADGEVTSVLARTSGTGGMVEQSFTPYTFPGTVAYIQCVKAGSVVSFKDGDDNTIASVDFGETVMFENTWGRLGLSSWGGHRVGFYYAGTFELLGDGELMQAKKPTFAVTYSRDHKLPSGTSIQSVVSQAQWGTYSAASGSAARARSRYEVVDSTTIRFYSETAPDVVRVQQAASTDPVPAPPGPAPRITTGIQNFATVADPGDQEFIATSDAAENRANWHDHVVVRSADGTCPHGPGDVVTIRRNAVCDPRDAHALQFDLKNGEGDFSTLSSGSYLARVSEGIFLPSDTWLAANVTGGAPPCFRLEATFIEHRANLDARTLNELAAGAEATEELFFPVRVTGAGASIAGQIVYAARPVGTTWEDDGNGHMQAQDLMLGVAQEVWMGDADALVAGGLSLPVPLERNSLGPVIMGQTATGAEGYTNAAIDYTLYADDPAGEGFVAEREWFGTETRPWYVWPWPDQAGMPGGQVDAEASTFFGAIAKPINGPDGHWLLGNGSFRLAGVAFDLPPEFTRAPKGSVVTKAWARVRFSGVRSWRWEYSLSDWFPRWTGGAGPEDFVTSENLSLNGTPVAYRQSPDPEEESFLYPGDYLGDTAEPSADVTFALIGRRRNSQNVRLDWNIEAWKLNNPGYTGEELAAEIALRTKSLPADEWRSFGAGVASGSTVEDGQWRVVEITAAIQALVDAAEDVYTGLMLVPTNAGVTFGTGADGMASYLMSLEPQLTLTTTGSGASWFSYTMTGSGQYTEFESLEIGEIHVQLRLPSGALEAYPIPHLPRGPMMAPPG
jgi:hypothetical protein